MIPSSDPQFQKLAATQFIKACLDQYSFEEAFQRSRACVADNSWTPQVENILTVLLSVEKLQMGSLETVESLEIFGNQVFNLYKNYEFSGRVITLAATLLSFQAISFWMSADLSKNFQERYEFFQEKFKKMGAREVVLVGRQYINSHRSSYVIQRVKFGKEQLGHYLSEQLTIGDSFEKKLKAIFSEANAAIKEEEVVLGRALSAAKNTIDSHYATVSNQNISAYRAYEEKVEAAKRQMKKKKRRGIFRAIVGIVAGIFFAPILAPKIFLSATGLGLLIGEGVILGVISAAISKKNILKGATISAFFSGFSEMFGGFLLDHLKKFKALRESLKIAAMAGLQTAIQGGKFIDNIVSGIGAHLGAKLLASNHVRHNPRLNSSEIVGHMKDAALRGIVTSGVVSLIRGTTVEKTLGAIGMGMAEAAASRLGRMATNESNAVAASDSLKTWFLEATKSYFSRQAANASIHSGHFPDSFATRQIADVSSQHSPQNNQQLYQLQQQQAEQQQRRQYFPMLAAFSDAMQVQHASDKKIVTEFTKKGDDFLEKCHRLLQEEAERRGQRGEYLPQYGIKTVELALPNSTIEATAIVVAGPVVPKVARVIGRGTVLTHRWIIAQRGANIAFKGGKYAGHIEPFKAQGHRQLRKTIRSYGEQIKYHEGYLKNPQSKCENWRELHPEKHVALKYHWKEDIRRLAIYREMSKRILKEKERAMVIAEKMAKAAKAAKAIGSEKLATMERVGAKCAQ
jgi:hypothetical protein